MFERDSKCVAIVALVLGLAMAASAASIKWTGTNKDANGIGYWEDAGNWTGGIVPNWVNKDKAQIEVSDQTVVVDDFAPNILKECDQLELAWGNWSKNLSFLIRSADGKGPGGVFKARVILMSPAGGQNSKLVVDKGTLTVTERLRCGSGNAANTPTASIIVNGGTVQVGRLSLMEKALPGTATLTINGGQVNVTQDLAAGPVPAASRINLNGGKLTVGSLTITPALAIDVNQGGTLVIKSNQVAGIGQMATSGQMTLGGQTAMRGGLRVAYDALAKETTVTADLSAINLNKAWSPAPLAVGGVPADTQLLTWKSGDATAAKAGHDVYFGTDSSAVSNDTAGNALGSYRGRVDTASMPMPVALQLGQTYYWRVDQLDSKGAITKGELWSFTVAGSFPIDNFDAYNNTEPNQIYTTWKDGYGSKDNGMQVGYLDPNYAETKIVKQGIQSMPLFYKNQGAIVNSEAKRTFASAQDWTKNGAKSLSLKFRGESINTLGKVYVKINDTKVFYPLLASHMQFAQWKPWIINFKDVAVDLTKVTSLAIGVDGASAGTLFIDDIRLYPKEAELMPALGSGVEPDKTRLVAQYLLNGDAQDSSGNGNHGQVTGTATWVDGVFGKALDLSTTTTGIKCTKFDPTGGTGTFTLCTWVYWENNVGVQHLLTKSNGWGATTQMFQVELKGSEWWVEESMANRLTLASAAFPQQASCASVPPREWVHVALTFNGTHANGYVNGIDWTGPQPTGIGPNVDIETYVGASNADSNRHLRGKMDDVRIYKYALSAAEVYGTIGVDLGFKPF